MNSATINPLTTVTLQGISACFGGLITGVIFNKISHIAEYTLNKYFSNNDSALLTSNREVIVTLGKKHDYYYTQNIALATLISTVAYMIIRSVPKSDCLIDLSKSLLIGSIATPILFALFNMEARRQGGQAGRWVSINDAEIAKRGIDASGLEIMPQSTYGYSSFGSAPHIFQGSEPIADDYN